MLTAKAATAWARDHLFEMTTLLEEVVLINSHTANKPGIDAVGRIFRRALQKAGLAVEIDPQHKNGDLLLASTPVAGASETVLLCGHMDTVFQVGGPFSGFRIQNGRCHGPGTADMKGGLVVALFALKLLAAQGRLADIPLLFLLNSEEETGSPVSRPLIKDLAAKCAAALVFECGGKQGQVVTGRKGQLGLKLSISGAAGHAGDPGATKASALLELAHKIIALENLNGQPPGLTVNVGRAEGGSGPNVVAAHAEAVIDVRFPDQAAEDGFLERIERLENQIAVKGVQANFSRTGGRPVMPPTKTNMALFERLQAQAGQLGLSIADEQRGGVSDANLIAAQGTPVLDGLGPVGGDDHSEKEYILHQSLWERTALAAMLIADLATRPLRQENKDGQGAAGLRPAH